MDFSIDLTTIEEHQMLKDIDELNRLFLKAKSAIVQGSLVHLTRNNNGENVVIESISSEEELLLYRQQVFRYL